MAPRRPRQEASPLLRSARGESPLPAGPQTPGGGPAQDRHASGSSRKASVPVVACVLAADPPAPAAHPPQLPRWYTLAITVASELPRLTELAALPAPGARPCHAGSVSRNAGISAISRNPLCEPDGSYRRLRRISAVYADAPTRGRHTAVPVMSSDGPGD